MQTFFWLVMQVCFFGCAPLQISLAASFGSWRSVDTSFLQRHARAGMLHPRSTLVC